MSDECKLRVANGLGHVPCEGESCTYWRLVGHLGVDEESSGCAVQHFALLDGGREIAEWLLSVKSRVEKADG